MSSKTLESPHDSLEFATVSEIVHFRNAQDNVLIECFAFSVFVVIGFVFLVLGASLAVAGNSSGVKLIGVATLVGTATLLMKLAIAVPNRMRFYREREPKLTLSGDALSDHRTMVVVELLDIDSIRFDRQFVKSAEIRADLHLVTKEGTDHVFDLRRLDMPSKQIAWRVTQAAQINKAEGVINPADDRLGPVGHAILAVLSFGVGWQIVNIANGLVTR